jgi:23S rRNA (guanosine2251-2'-O)-methyltransferase
MDQPALYVIANNIRSLYNVGALFRLCDAAGVDELYLCGLTGAPHAGIRHTRQREQIAKTALGGLDGVSWQYYEHALDVVRELKDRGVQVVALEQTPTSHPYQSFSYQFPLAIVLGHEVDGVAPDVLANVDASVELPMYGRGNSLNVISSASILLYHLRSII